MIHCFGTADEKLNVNAGIAALGHPTDTAARALSQPRSPLCKIAAKGVEFQATVSAAGKWRRSSLN
jgi:hypothetical protein